MPSPKPQQKNTETDTSLNPNKIGFYEPSIPSITISCPPVLQQDTTNIFSSITETAIQQHSLIKNILEKTRQDCVKHQEKIISPGSKLYRQQRYRMYTQPQQNSKELHKNRQFRKIYLSLIQDEAPWKKIQESNTKRKRKASSSTAQVQSKIFQYNKKVSQEHKKRAKMRINTSYEAKNSKRVSLSALTTYNFTSIKARHRLAFDPHAAQKTVERSLTQAKEQSEAAQKRNLLLHMKTDPVQATIWQQMGQAISHKYKKLETKNYLKGLQKWKQSNRNIYGQKQKYICSITALMQLDQDQQDAEFLVKEATVNIKQKLSKKGKLKRRAQSRNQQKEFQSRRVPSSIHRVMVPDTQEES